MYYKYKVLPSVDLLSYLQAATLKETDAYVSDDAVSQVYLKLIQEGFKWTSCEQGYAIFELETDSFARDVSSRDVSSRDGSDDKPEQLLLDPTKKTKPDKSSVCSLIRKEGVNNWVKLICRNCDDLWLAPSSKCIGKTDPIAGNTVLWTLDPYKCGNCGDQITHGEESLPEKPILGNKEWNMRDDGLMESKKVLWVDN